MEHDTVLLEEAVEALCRKKNGHFVDGTFGRGGHSRALLSRLGPDSRLWGVDKDPDAVREGRKLEQNDSRFSIIHESFSNMDRFISPLSMDGILFDLGVSSPQLDNPERGFSFIHDGPLDMRMDPNKGVSVSQWLKNATVEEIANVLWEFGEERFSRRMAAAIVKERQNTDIVTTRHLAEIVSQANPKWEKHKHPATRAFQALRIFINNELDDLKKALDLSVDLLKPEGRLVVISFHSLEDRIVKQFIRRESQQNYSDIPRWIPLPETKSVLRLKKVGKPVKASTGEVRKNIRARSAIMRVAEKRDNTAK